MRSPMFTSLNDVVRQRSRSGWWAYLIWLLLYLFTAFLFAEEAHFHSGAGANQFVPLLIPVVIVLLQWVRPTILGWSIIFLLTVLYFCVGVYYVFTNNLGPQPQWAYDSSGLVVSLLFLLALLGVCIALAFTRPR